MLAVSHAAKTTGPGRTVESETTTTTTDWLATATWATTTAETATPATTTPYAPTSANYASAKPDAFANAAVGDCIHRELGASHGDGTSELTVLYLASCSQPEATDRVVMRTDVKNN